MVHEMKLQPKYYDFIDKGTKRIEIRLFDEKRSLIQLGDKIKFLKMPELQESMIVRVIGLLRYKSFSDLVNDFDVSILADQSMTKDELIDVVQEFYSVEKQKQYGVLGIRIEKI